MNTHNKSYILLCMYDALRKGKPLFINECLCEYKISIATFRRYIALLRVYIADAYGSDVEYLSSERAYRLAADAIE